MAVQLRFQSMEDFEPGRIVQQVEPLRKLLEARDKLRDLSTRVDRSDELESALEQILKSADNVKKLAGELGKQPEATKPAEGGQS